MNGIIIIEGPDGSGKTTLAERIIANNEGKGIYLHAEYKFKNKMKTYHLALLTKAIKLSRETLVIIDRLHISEYIYAKIFRGGSKWPEQLEEFNTICRHLHIPIVLCVPYKLEEGITWFEQAKQERKELYEDITKVIEEYINYAKEHKKDRNVLIYNRDDAVLYHSWYNEYFDAALKNYIKGDKNGFYGL